MQDQIPLASSSRMLYSCLKTSLDAVKMRSLKIVWQRLIHEGQTCPRCSSTEKEIDKAISVLERHLEPVGIALELEKKEISMQDFEKDPLLSNQIWINDKPLEQWLGARTRKSRCCSVCGDNECRTVEIVGEEFEEIPAPIIIEAVINAAEELIRSTE
jgi:hypothetical protein